jgi:integrase
MIRRLVRLHGERSEVRDRVTPHMFRHSVATYLLEEGVDIRYVQRLLGHRSISTTEMYTQVADSALKVRINEKHPRRGIVRVAMRHNSLGADNSKLSFARRVLRDRPSGRGT